MAKILYGVMGNTYGHVMRTQAITSLLMPEHEFYFVGGGRVPEALGGKGSPLLEVPVLRTVHRNGKVSVSATTGQIVGCTLESPKIIRGIREVIEHWQPDLAVADREFFLPIACARAGLRCISLDHSHVLKACRYPVPPGQWVSWSLAMINDYLFFDRTRHNLIVSFFHPPLQTRPRAGEINELLPPVLRRAVAAQPPGPAGDHVLVYQTSTGFRPLLGALRRLKRPVVAYGLGTREKTREGNITFKPYSDRGILEDLAGCAYAVVNGGHNLICEALHFRKPVLCFPIARLFEQFINAWHVRASGYGDFSTESHPQPATFERFEENLEERRRRLGTAGSFDGTAQVAARLRTLATEAKAKGERQKAEG